MKPFERRKKRCLKRLVKQAQRNIRLIEEYTSIILRSFGVQEQKAGEGQCN